jgi:hypothetical protein
MLCCRYIQNTYPSHNPFIDGATENHEAIVGSTGLTITGRLVTQNNAIHFFYEETSCVMKGTGSPVGDITERTPQQLMTMQDFAIGIIKAKIDEALRLERCELTSYVSQYFPEYSEQPELFFKEKPLQAYDFHMSLQVAHHNMKDILRQLDPQIKAWAILEAMYQHQNRQWENQLHVAREAHNRALDLSAQNIATLELVLKERKQEYEDRINEWKERKQEYEDRINEWKQWKQEYEDRIKEWKEHKGPSVDISTTLDAVDTEVIKALCQGMGLIN